MGRKILFITTDQQRYDALGCNGGRVARTPVIDGLAANGIVFDRAHPQNVVCMPSRSTMLTGQHVSTHGVWMNGVPLASDAPSIASDLRRAGYRTALIGKAHFEPFIDPFLRFAENRIGSAGLETEMVVGEDGLPTPHRGFEHFALATHGGMGPFHYARWLREKNPSAAAMFFQVLDQQLQVNAGGGGDTNAPQVKHNDIPRELYHTEWVADQTIDWLSSLPADADWFCWMSFPDPHHPWDPPKSEIGRVNWRDLDLPDGYIVDATERERVLDAKPRHWRMWYEGTFVSNYEAPAKWVPKTLTADNVREVNAMAHIENELIDEAIGRVLASVVSRGWGDDVDVLYTTDHGELQGDYGLLFKGPYHTDSLMRLPLVWSPAKSAMVAPARVSAPVGLVSLAATFADIAGIARPDYTESARLPTNDEDARELGHERVLTEWDSVLFGKIVHARTICRDGWICTAMLSGTVHDGTEGELYDLANDPLQHNNLWNSAQHAAQRASLLDDMWSSLPTRVLPLRSCDAPV
ncbi:MAG: sulfatase [Ilumatobacteraceae bacterium]